VLTSLHSTLRKNILHKKGTQNSDTLAHKSSSVLAVPCQKEPINEFLENDKLFLGAFPDLFFLEIKTPKIGSFSNSFTQHLLGQSDNRFSQVDEPIFSLFNQSQRHASAREVATRVRSDTKSVGLFIDIIEAPNFMEDLKCHISTKL